MKHIIVSSMIMLTFSTFLSAKKEAQLDQTHSSETVAIQSAPKIPLRQIIVAYIMNILHHCTQIAVDPHNRPNLGNNITGILGSIVNIALVASDKNKHKAPVVGSPDINNQIFYH